MSVINKYFKNHANTQYLDLIEQDKELIASAYHKIKDSLREKPKEINLFNVFDEYPQVVEKIREVEQTTPFRYIPSVRVQRERIENGKIASCRLRYKGTTPGAPPEVLEYFQGFYEHVREYRNQTGISFNEIIVPKNGRQYDYKTATETLTQKTYDHFKGMYPDSQVPIESKKGAHSPNTLSVDVDFTSIYLTQNIKMVDSLTKEVLFTQPQRYNPNTRTHEPLSRIDSQDGSIEVAGQSVYLKTSSAPVFYHAEKGYIVFEPRVHIYRYKEKKNIEETYSFTILDLIHGKYYSMYEKLDTLDGEITSKESHVMDFDYNHDEDEANFMFNNTFIEAIYGLPRNTINKQIPLQKYVRLLQYTGNLFQSFIQTQATSPWFLDNIMATMRNVVSAVDVNKLKTLDEKNIQTWLDLSLPDYKYLLNQPTQDMMVHFMLANKHKPTSLNEFLKTHDKILELNKKWLSEFKEKGTYYGIANLNNSVILKNKRNKYIMSSTTLPDFMRLYVQKSLHNHTSLYRYLKYIIDEGKRSYNKEDGTYLTLKQIEDDLVDYNRMLKEINPKTPFVFPYKIKNAHDTMVTNYNEIMQERGINAENDAVANGRKSYDEIYAIADPLCYQTEKYLVCTPHSTYDLHIEGSTLNHCVGSYSTQVLEGRSLIFFLRTQQNPERPLLTIELRKSWATSFQQNQIRGKGNRYPNAEEQEFVDQWVEAYNSNYKQRQQEKQKAYHEKRKQKLLNQEAFDKPMVEIFKMYGFKEFDYNPSTTKENNYRDVVQKGFKNIIDKQKEDGMIDHGAVSAIITVVEKVLKNQRFNPREYIPKEAYDVHLNYIQEVEH